MAELIFWTPAAVVALVVIVIIFCIVYDIVVSIYVTVFPPKKPTEYAFQQLLNIETQVIDLFFLYIVYGGIIAALGTYIYLQVTGNLLPDMLNIYPRPKQQTQQTYLQQTQLQPTLQQPNYQLQPTLQPTYPPPSY